MKKILGIFLLIFGMFSFRSYAATLVGTPSINFGTATHVSDNSGYSQIKISVTGSSGAHGTQTATVAASGSGNLGNYQENYTLIPIQFTDMIKNNRLYIRLSNPPTKIQTACGTLSLSAIKLGTSGAPYYKITESDELFSATTGIYVQATASLDEPVPSAGTCTIFGEIPFEYAETRNSFPSSWTSGNIAVYLTLQSSVSISHNTNAALNFGTFCKSTTQNQSLTVNADGSVGANTVACAPPPATISADSFTVNLSSVPSYSVNLPATASLNGSNGGELTVSNFTTSCGNSPCTVTGGSGSFAVGGTINVPANPPVGDYEGTYGVSITY